MLGTEDRHLTDWGLNAKPGPRQTMTTSASLTMINSTAPLLKKGNLEQPAPIGSGLRPTKTFEPVPPMCIKVAHKHFGVKFSVLSREPGIYLEGATVSQWQPVRAGKGTLL